jgi:hypothetical protein
MKLHSEDLADLLAVASNISNLNHGSNIAFLPIAPFETLKKFRKYFISLEFKLQLIRS